MSSGRCTPLEFLPKDPISFIEVESDDKYGVVSYQGGGRYFVEIPSGKKSIQAFVERHVGLGIFPESWLTLVSRFEHPKADKTGPERGLVLFYLAMHVERTERALAVFQELLAIDPLFRNIAPTAWRIDWLHPETARKYHDVRAQYTAGDYTREISDGWAGPVRERYLYGLKNKHSDALRTLRFLVLSDAQNTPILLLHRSVGPSNRPSRKPRWSLT